MKKLIVFLLLFSSHISYQSDKQLVETAQKSDRLFRQWHSYLPTGRIDTCGEMIENINIKKLLKTCSWSELTRVNRILDQSHDQLLRNIVRDYQIPRKIVGRIGEKRVQFATVRGVQRYIELLQKRRMHINTIGAIYGKLHTELEKNNQKAKTPFSK